MTLIFLLFVNCLVFLRILILIFYLLWRLTNIQIVFGLIKSLSNFPWKWTLTHPNWLLKTTLILKVCLYYLFFWYIPKMVSPFIFPFFRWFLCKRIQYSQLIKILFFIPYYLYFFLKKQIFIFKLNIPFWMRPQHSM